MGWYARYRARHETVKAPRPGPLSGGDDITARLAPTAPHRRRRAGAAATRTIAVTDNQDAIKGAKQARKRERKLARRGTAGPS
jgi:hypothetical protein